MHSIAFLEVDGEDEALVRREFPDAIVRSDAPEGADLTVFCKDAEAVSCFIHTKFTADVIAQLPSLKLISTRSVGYDHIDGDACAVRGIILCNVPDYGSHVIAEHVFALLLSTLRHVPEAGKKVKEGVFDYHGLRGMALRGKTLGIVGTGKIGRRVAQIAHGFGMHILAVDQCRTVQIEDMFGVRYVSFQDMLRESDIITLHVPGTPETHHLINAHAFDTMKDGVILVNTARGSLIDSSALLDALKAKKVGYALLDVLEHEKNFQENEELIALPNVVTTPHIAFYADDSMKSMYRESIESIREWMDGKTPEHVVHPLHVVCDLPAIRRV